MQMKKLAILLLIFLMTLVTGNVLAQAAGVRIHLDLEGDSDFIGSLKNADSPFGVPPNCANWHELSPNFCKIHHQDDYFDTDDDKCLSKCDGIKLSGQWYHIVWVGWTLFCDDGSYTLEPADIDPTDPTLTAFFEVAPDYGRVHKLKQWSRADGTEVKIERRVGDAHNAIPEPKEGDLLTFADADAEPCEVVRRSVDIIVEPRDTAPSDSDDTTP